MLAVKPEIEEAISEVARALGYSVELGKAGHAGRTFFLGYRGSRGLGNIKIDFTYLNRVPLFPIEGRSTPLRDGLLVPVLSDYELAGGKIKAFFDRVKVRDLYDISNLMVLLEGMKAPERRELFHKAILFDAALSAAFPFSFEGREQRFANRQKELEEELYPMLRVREVGPSLKSLMEDAAVFIAKWVTPQNESELEFFNRLACGDFKPDLIFAENDLLLRATKSPAVAWKLENLRRMNR